VHAKDEKTRRFRAFRFRRFAKGPAAPLDPDQGNPASGGQGFEFLAPAPRGVVAPVGRVGALGGGGLGAAGVAPRGLRRAFEMDRHPFILARQGGPVSDAAELQPGLQGDDRAGGVAGAAADLDFAPPGLAAHPDEDALVQEFDPAGAVLGVVGPAVEPGDLAPAQAAGEADQQDGAVAQAAQTVVEGGDHAQEIVGDAAEIRVGGSHRRLGLRPLPGQAVAHTDGDPQGAVSNCTCRAQPMASVVRR
jgi:hypothetical protein